MSFVFAQSAKHEDLLRAIKNEYQSSMDFIKKHRRTYSIRSIGEMMSMEPIKGPTVVPKADDHVANDNEEKKSR